MNMAVYQPQQALVERSTFEIMPAAIELAGQLAMTDFVPRPLRGNKPAIMAAILTGHEVGLPPMASLANIDIIEGRPNLRAAAQRALILSRGHELGFEEMTATRCVMWGRRRGAQQITTVAYTMDDARRAQLAGKSTWQKNPGDMLVARATGKLGRAIFADVLVGIPYNREELEDGEEEAREGAEPPAGETSGNGTRKRRAARAAIEPPPAPDIPAADSPRPAQAEPPPDPSQAPAGEPPADGSMPLNQQIAMVCRELEIDRKALVHSLTGKERGSDLTRQEAIAVLEMARAIQRGEMRLAEVDGDWLVLPVEPGQDGLPGVEP